MTKRKQIERNKKITAGHQVNLKKGLSATESFCELAKKYDLSTVQIIKIINPRGR